MPTFPLRRDLGLQLLALSLFFIGLVVAGTLLFARLASPRLEADVKAADLALARAIAQETNIVMENALAAVGELSEYPAVRAIDVAAMEPLFHTLMSARNDVNLVYRLDEQGTMVYHYPVGPASTVSVDFSFRDYFQTALHTEQPFISAGRISPTTAQPVATAVMPLWDEAGRFEGVVATNLMLEALSRSLQGIVNEYGPDQRFAIVIIDANGQIVASPTAELLLAGAERMMPHTVSTAVTAHESGNLVLGGPQGEEMLYSFVPVPSVGWGVVVGRPTAIAFATPFLFQRAALVAIAVFLVGGTIFWIGLARYVIWPLERLTNFSQSIGQHQSSPRGEQEALERVAKRPDQLGHLTRSMQRMQQSIEARLNELSTLLETSAAVVSTLDLQIVLDRILQQVGRLLDVEMCAIFALDEKTGSFRIQASRGLASWYADEATIDPAEANSVTMRAIRSGEPVQVSDTETTPTFLQRRARARAAGYRSVLAVPLKLQHAPPSALLIFRPDQHVFAPREISLLSSFANHAAMAIENATLYQRSDMRLQEQTRRLEALIQSMQDGLILENMDGHVIYTNRRIEELTGCSAGEMRQQSIEQVMAPLIAQIEEPETAAAIVAARAEKSAQVEFAVDRPEGRRYLRLKLFDVTDANNLPLGRGWIIQDITQRYEVDRMKSSLIATVSHELRTPLAAVKGYASTLLADDVQWDAASQREFMQIISDESDRLSYLVDDLLDMSRIEAGTLQVSRQPCALGELVLRAAQHAHPAPGERLQVTLPADLPPVDADPQRITAVLRNLIENATKYGDPAGSVRVRATQENGAIVVSVEDEGPGIPAEYSDRVFDSFYRVQNGLTRNKMGAGLGLSISRGFVRAHGGDIWLEPSDKGACVRFTLPVHIS
jgi:PAS domain S-box-containing protein